MRLKQPSLWWTAASTVPISHKFAIKHPHNSENSHLVLARRLHEPTSTLPSRDWAVWLWPSAQSVCGCAIFNTIHTVLRAEAVTSLPIQPSASQWNLWISHFLVVWRFRKGFMFSDLFYRVDLTMWYNIYMKLSQHAPCQPVCEGQPGLRFSRFCFWDGHLTKPAHLIWGIEAHWLRPPMLYSPFLLVKQPVISTDSTFNRICNHWWSYQCPISPTC